MLKKSLRYEQGDIVILELPLTDLLGSKLRPVLVLNAIDLGDDNNSSKNNKLSWKT